MIGEKQMQDRGDKNRQEAKHLKRLPLVVESVVVGTAVIAAKESLLGAMRVLTDWDNDDDGPSSGTSGGLESSGSEGVSLEDVSEFAIQAAVVAVVYFMFISAARSASSQGNTQPQAA